MQSTKHTLVLQIYGFSDRDLLQQVRHLEYKGIDTSIFYDPSGSSALEKKGLCAHPIARKGLMHKKILIIDDALTFISTANFTPTSLCMHDNVAVAIHNLELVDFLLHAPENKFFFKVQEQDAEFWHLPDSNGECLHQIIKQIDHADSHIYGALFTFTHPKILQAILSAKKRGVEVRLALDYSNVQGSCKKTAETLCKNKIETRISQKGSKLLHYKWCVIDDKTLIMGSANWTKSAFEKNEDCVFILHDLNTQQKKHFQKIWRGIQSHSTSM